MQSNIIGELESTLSFAKKEYNEGALPYNAAIAQLQKAYDEKNCNEILGD